MTLSDAQVERYSRQIIVPEVGGRGQVALLGAHVALAGAGDDAALAATLLARAGVGRLDLVGGTPPLGDLGPDCRVRREVAVEDAAGADVAVDLGDAPALGRRLQERGRPVVLGRLDAAGPWAATLVGRPCVACVLLPAAGDAARPALAAPLRLALGALAASEALQALWAPPEESLLQRIDAGGALESVRLEGTGACPVCGGRA